VSSNGVLVRRGGDSQQTAVTEREYEDVDTMMPYSMSTLYQAERVKSDAERREVEAEAGMLVADLSRFRDDVARFLRPLRRHRRKLAGFRAPQPPGSQPVSAGR
jgi:hypothetical protein